MESGGIRRCLLCLAALWVLAAGCTHKAAYLTLGQGAPGRLSRHRVAQETKCAGELHSYNYKMCCEIQVPIDGGLRTTAELQEFVRAHKHVRAIGARHSSNGQICVERKEDRVVQLSSLRHEPGYEAVRVYPRTGPGGERTWIADVDASLTIGELNDELSRQNYTLGFGSVFFRGVTVAGALATGAHGTHLQNSSVLASRLAGVTIVDAAGERRTFTPENTADAVDLWPSLQTHMGLLGLVTRAWLRAEPDFWVRVREGRGPERRLLATEDPRTVLSGCEWGHIVWFPRAHHYITQCGERSAQGPATGQPRWENGLLRPYTTPLLTNLLKRYMSRRRSDDRCWLEDAVFGHRWRKHGLMRPSERGVDRGEHRWDREAVGRPHLMTTSDVSEYQDRIPQFDFEIAIPMRHAQAALRYASRWISEHRLCLPLIGVFLRFSGGAATGLVAHSEHGVGPYEPVMFFEFVVYAPHGREIDDDFFISYRELAKDMVRRYGGRGHWGKNEDGLFQAQRERLSEYAERLRRFARIARCMDPRGVFDTSFARRAGLTDDREPPNLDCSAVQLAGTTERTTP